MFVRRIIDVRRLDDVIQWMLLEKYDFALFVILYHIHVSLY